jgi:hypothetical protein
MAGNSPIHTTGTAGAPGPTDATAAFWQGLAEVGMEYSPLRSYDGPVRQPKCFTEHEFLSWLACNEEAGDDAAISPCQDCTPAFAAEQREAGMCNGTPGESLTKEDTKVIKAAQQAKAMARKEARKGRKGRPAKYGSTSTCREDGCQKKPLAKGLCNTHYERLRFRTKRATTLEQRV